MASSLYDPSEMAQRARKLAKCSLIPPTPLPDRVYGVYLTEECLVRFGDLIRKQLKLPINPDPVKDAYLSKTVATLKLPIIVQIAIRGLTLTQLRVALVRPFGPLGIRRLLVLSDFGSARNRKMRNTPEVEKQLVEFLGLGDQKPKWYRTVAWYAVLNVSSVQAINFELVG
ncbi:hypothetical protein HGRIS_014517 [Hohenbuehelia grisea]|uniref:Uncharacterized protein n=1 Tax=Hohenbuehelia grisea TaxID=104357 RepID=A0ABR3JUB4_9AGAR